MFAIFISSAVLFVIGRYLFKDYVSLVGSMEVFTELASVR